MLAELVELHQQWDRTLMKPRWTDGHVGNTTMERGRAAEEGTRQFPMDWIER